MWSHTIHVYLCQGLETVLWFMHSKIDTTVDAIVLIFIYFSNLDGFISCSPFVIVNAS